jgi:hypothetical protein
MNQNHLKILVKITTVEMEELVNHKAKITTAHASLDLQGCFVKQTLTIVQVAHVTLEGLVLMV